MRKLFIIGTGPGSTALLAPAASAALQSCSEVVGYRLYLDLLGTTIAGKNHYYSNLGSESERARKALELAVAGSTTALVSSGDAGIYAMASLVFECLETTSRQRRSHAADGTHTHIATPGTNAPTPLAVEIPNSAIEALEIEVIPGISAMQLAAARVGAPLGHDFCTISLSDLLTPWRVIERRLEAAAMGDFVVALYNPVSQRRDWQLGRARDILLAQRAPDTPVVLGRNLGRTQESVHITTLCELRAEQIDMLTLVLIGSSETRRFGHWVYTPRGYGTPRQIP